MSNESESRIQEKIMYNIRKYGGYVYKNAQNIYTEKGRPDLTACIPVTLKTLTREFGENAKVGIFLGVEVKKDKDKGYGTTAAQEIVGRQIKKANGLWFSIDDPDLMEALMIRLTGDN